jgi:hypothetical protein
MFCDETFHAAITVCVELSLQAQEMSQSSGPAMEGMNTSVLLSMVQSQQNVMLQAVERSLDDFGRRVGSGTGKGSKSYFFLSLILASVKSRIKGEDPFCMIQAASKRAVRVGRGIVSGLSFHEALANADRPPPQVSFPFSSSFHEEALLRWNYQPAIPLDGPMETTPLSVSSIDFDFPSLLSADFGDFAVSSTFRF